MSRFILKNNRIKRKLRVRKTVFGTAEKPRLSVFRSNKFIYGQIINDEAGVTLVDVQKEVIGLAKGKNRIEASAIIGKELAKKAAARKIKTVVFDRNGYRYHGRVKSFAEGAREGGLNF